MQYDLAAMGEDFRRKGVISPVRLLHSRDAEAQRIAMESVEAGHGPLHGLPKVHTLLDFAADLAVDEAVLDVVEALIGPDILLLDVTYRVVEPGCSIDETRETAAGNGQVSMCLALSDASAMSGESGLAAGEAIFWIGGEPLSGHRGADEERVVFFEARYAVPAVSRAASGTETASLLRGEDANSNYVPDILATGVMDEGAVERHAARNMRGTKSASA